MLGTALIYQVSVVLTVGFVILTIGAPVPVGAVIAFVPVVAMAQVIPISLSGLGVREGMFVLLLHPLGIPNGQAIGIGLLWYLDHAAREPARCAGVRGRQPPSGFGRRRIATVSTTHRTFGRPELHRRLWAAKVLRDGHVIYWWVEMLAIGLFYIVYSAVRNADRVKTVAAFHNAKQIMDWQQHARHQPRADDQRVGAALQAARHRAPTTSTARCTSSSPSASASTCSGSGRTTTRAGATRSGSPPRSRSSASGSGR